MAWLYDWLNGVQTQPICLLGWLIGFLASVIGLIYNVVEYIEGKRNDEKQDK